MQSISNKSKSKYNLMQPKQVDEKYLLRAIRNADSFVASQALPTANIALLLMNDVREELLAKKKYKGNIASACSIARRESEKFERDMLLAFRLRNYATADKSEQFFLDYLDVFSESMKGHVNGLLLTIENDLKRMRCPDDKIVAKVMTACCLLSIAKDMQRVMQQQLAMKTGLLFSNCYDFPALYKRFLSLSDAISGNAESLKVSRNVQIAIDNIARIVSSVTSYEDITNKAMDLNKEFINQLYND